MARTKTPKIRTTVSPSSRQGPQVEATMKAQRSSQGLTILVTGGAGMLGTHIVEELLTGQVAHTINVREVRVYDRVPFTRLGELSFESSQTYREINAQTVLSTFEGDILDRKALSKAMDGCDYVIHSCSVVDFGNIPKEVIWNVNVKGTQLVVEVACSMAVAGVLYTSSLDVILPSTLPGILNADENVPYTGKSQDSMYVKSKMEAEKFCVKNSSPRMPIVVLRPPGIYGERSKYHISAELDAATASGAMNIFKIGLGESIFQRSYAGNVAHVHVCALRSMLLSPKACDGKIYFAVDDTPVVNFFRFAEPFLKAKGHKIPTVGLPYLLMYYVAWLVETTNKLLLLVGLGSKSLLFTREAVQGTCLSFSATGVAAKEKLGYKPIYGLQESFDRTLQYYCRNPDFENGPYKYEKSEFSSLAEVLDPPIVGREARCQSWTIRFVVFAVYYVVVLLPYSVNFEVPWASVGPVGSVTVENAYAVLTDFEMYPEWNTFTHHVETVRPLRAGNKATLQVALNNALDSRLQNLTLNFEFLEVTANTRVCWQYNMVPEYLKKYVLRTRRCFEVSSNESNVLVRHFDCNSGPLAPLVKALYKDSVEAGFRKMTSDLRRRLKQMYSF
jgi:nucleoside-diphosphate-sugar epimerase